LSLRAFSPKPFKSGTECRESASSESAGSVSTISGSVVSLTILTRPVSLYVLRSHRQRLSPIINTVSCSPIFFLIKKVNLNATAAPSILTTSNGVFHTLCGLFCKLSRFLRDFDNIACQIPHVVADSVTDKRLSHDAPKLEMPTAPKRASTRRLISSFSQICSEWRNSDFSGIARPDMKL